jgi:uncharacterized protein (TIGR00251 family)
MTASFLASCDGCFNNLNDQDGKSRGKMVFFYMRVSIRVIPRAKQNKVVEEADRVKVYLTVPPVEGRANQALIALLAAHFQVRKSDIRIVRGEKSRDKIIEIG